MINERTIVWATLALSLLVFALHLLFVRPYLWPAGAGVTLSGDIVMGPLAELPLVPRVRPPDLTAIDQIVVTQVMPGSEAARRGVTSGMPVSDRLTVEDALRTWRNAYVGGPSAGVQLIDQGSQHAFSWQPQSAWRVNAEARDAWLRQHTAALVQMAGFLGGAILLVALGSRGTLEAMRIGTPAVRSAVRSW